MAATAALNGRQSSNRIRDRDIISGHPLITIRANSMPRICSGPVRAVFFVFFGKVGPDRDGKAFFHREEGFAL
jgi:hypothetical protein